MRIAELQPILDGLVGMVVTSKNIAGNSIALWLGADPEAEQARCVWIDPPWRMETVDGIESSSFGFPGDKDDNESEADYKSRFKAACAATDCLKGATIASAVVNPMTGDVSIAFNCARTLRLFAVDLEYENWHLTDYGSGFRYGVWATHVDVERLDDPAVMRSESRH